MLQVALQSVGEMRRLFYTDGENLRTLELPNRALFFYINQKLVTKG